MTIILTAYSIVIKGYKGELLMPGKKEMKKYNRQSGNALFLILIAVALFAALSYAVTQSGRGGGTIDRETAMIAASQITQFPSTIRTAITRMVITGVTVGEVHFNHDNTHPEFADFTDEGNVFHPSGGGSVKSKPPANIGSAQGDYPVLGVLSNATWGYKDVMHADQGYYIKGVGTDTDTTGRDIFAYLHDITVGVCEQINKGLGVEINPIPDQTIAVDYTMNGGQGAVAGSSTTAAQTGATNVFFPSDGTTDLDGVAFACFRNGGTLYDYYHALVEQ